MLISNYSGKLLECGVDEVGRGCISGPVVAAAVILPMDYQNQDIKDSKKLSEKKREALYDTICEDAIDYAIVEIDAPKIDEINILNASILAMHHAIDKLFNVPEFILVDGNQFKSCHNIPHECVVKGDSKYLSIAAASILAKVHRDRLMTKLDESHPAYEWKKNKGYPTKAHKAAVALHGITEYHRKTFKMS